jgi:hypothetical protein
MRMNPPCGGTPRQVEANFMIVAIWILAVVCIALWSLAAWGLHGLLTIDPAALSALHERLAQIPYAEQIEAWIPQWREWLRFGIEMLQWGLAQIGTAAPVVIALIWGLGVLAALVVAGLLSLLVKLIRSEFPTTPQRGMTPG